MDEALSKSDAFYPFKRYDNRQRAIFAPLGTGGVDVKAVMHEGHRAGVKWWIVEQDQCIESPLSSIKKLSIYQIKTNRQRLFVFIDKLESIQSLRTYSYNQYLLQSYVFHKNELIFRDDPSHAQRYRL